ncbi:MAG: hypothetical protein EOP04_12880 [Proteobacteria bacterium]|nr:MAG: hypothetical protein EOP04_12880 [Pseudomonadota bacterium]
MNVKQSALIKQLNYLDVISETHGKYLVLRDSYLFGRSGSIEASKPVFIKLKAWTDKWPAFLARLSFADAADVNANLLGTDTKLSLKEEFRLLVRDLDEILAAYNTLVIRNREAIQKINTVSELNPNEFDDLGDSVAESVNLIKKKQMKDRVIIVNRQLGELRRNFKELNESANGKLISAITKFKEDVYKVLILKVSIYSLQFPELQKSIEDLEKGLLTNNAVDPLLEKAELQFTQISRNITGTDFLAAEQGIKKLQKIVESDFDILSANSLFDKVRVEEDRKYARLRLNSVKASLNAGYESRGGRREVIANFIARSADRIAPLCKEGSIQRMVLDCNLFRTNVAPFVTLLKQDQATDQLGEQQLEIIAGSLRDVARGPLNGEK